MIKNIIFDVGDVLIEYRWKQMLMDYGLSDSEAERVGTCIFDDPDKLWGKYDLGLFSEKEIIEAYSKKYPDDAEVISWFIQHGEYMSVPRPHVWDKIKELKDKGYSLFILSNYPEILFHKHTQYADFIPCMDGILVSYMVKLAKPDAAIYQELFHRFDIKAEESIFFDDRLENVNAAIENGMQAVQIRNKDQLLEELELILNGGRM